MSIPFSKKPGTPDGLVGEIGRKVTFVDSDGRRDTATLVGCYDEFGRDVYVLRHDDGLEELIGIEEIFSGADASQLPNVRSTG